MIVIEQFFFIGCLGVRNKKKGVENIMELRPWVTAGWEAVKGESS